MHKNIITLIAAVSRNNILAVNNRLPWHIPEEMKFFREITCNRWHLRKNPQNNKYIIEKIPDSRFMTNESRPSQQPPPPPPLPVVLMGRRTYESIPNRTLTHREIIVISRQHQFATIDAALEKFKNQQRQIFILGGKEIYNECLQRQLCNYLIISQINVTVKLPAIIMKKTTTTMPQSPLPQQQSTPLSMAVAAAAAAVTTNTTIQIPLSQSKIFNENTTTTKTNISNIDYTTAAATTTTTTTDIPLVVQMPEIPLNLYKLDATLSIYSSFDIQIYSKKHNDFE